MRFYLSLLTILSILLIPACSGGNSDPVQPNANPGISSLGNGVETGEASDVLYLSSGEDILAYKAFGIYQVTIDPVALTGEIIPARNASAIGVTFDADLTQFLTVTPCSNCLRIDGIQLTGENQINVGFAVKHPFADPSKRPDLHGFDARGIVLSKGNYNFPATMVQLTETNAAAARANVGLIANADGYTHHFDELATDIHYFDPPRDYDANINPFKRYFTSPTAGLFNFNTPSGYNVIPCGSDWETQTYTFNLAPGSPIFDFGFVVDCAYGASATLANRFNPYYFLPEFNRKEAWKATPSITSNALMSGVTTSSAVIKVQVFDWQAGKEVDPNYPNILNLDGLKAESDVASVSIEIPSVSGLVSLTNPSSGNGSSGNPYVFNLTVTNSQAAPSGNYYAIVAVRDDLQGQQGPMGIPESPAGFPYKGPEIYDYSTYGIFPIRVKGTAPDVTQIVQPTNVYEQDILQLNATVVEPDGDAVTYLWEQTSPADPLGTFIDPNVKNAQFAVPAMDDIDPSGITFTLQLKASDVDGEDSKTVTFTAYENNHAPICSGIESDPFLGIIDNTSTIDLYANAYDADGDDLIIDWDMSYNGNFFIAEETGEELLDYSWANQGFYNVMCRITEDRENPLTAACTRLFIQEGLIDESRQVDNESMTPLPSLSYPDVAVISDRDGNSTFYVIYNDLDSGAVTYCQNSSGSSFQGHYEIAPELTEGYTSSPKIAVNGTAIVALWLEGVPQAAVYEKRLKTRNSNNSGGLWAGEIEVKQVVEPTLILSADLCKGTETGEFYLFYTTREAANYQCMVMMSITSGSSWSTPGAPSNGQFRDTVNNTLIGMPMITMSANGTLHAAWVDSRSGTPQIYYDYSLDQGATWHTDIQLTSGTGISDAEMRVDDAGNIYLVSIVGTAFDFLKVAAGNPPTPGTSVRMADSIGTPHGVSLYVSPDGGMIVAPIGYQSTNYIMRYLYSFNDGFGWNYTERNMGSTRIEWPDCQGAFFQSPDRIKLCNTWIDYRVSVDPSAHIFGDFLYLAKRF